MSSLLDKRTGKHDRDFVSLKCETIVQLWFFYSKQRLWLIIKKKICLHCYKFYAFVVGELIN
jgi:hypothetical protein